MITKKNKIKYRINEQDLDRSPTKNKIKDEFVSLYIYIYIYSDTNSTNLIYLFNNNINVLSPYFWVLKTLRVKFFTHKQRIPHISKFFENPLSITTR